MGEDGGSVCVYMLLFWGRRARREKVRDLEAERDRDHQLCVFY